MWALWLPQGDWHPSCAWRHGGAGFGDVQLALREDCAGVLRHRRACKHRHYEALFGGLRLSGAAARLGVCTCVVGCFGCHDCGGHLAQFAGGYDESSEVTTQ